MRGKGQWGGYAQTEYRGRSNQIAHFVKAKKNLHRQECATLALRWKAVNHPDVPLMSAGCGILVGSVHPAFVSTPITDTERDNAAVVVQFVSQRRSGVLLRASKNDESG